MSVRRHLNAWSGHILRARSVRERVAAEESAPAADASPRMLDVRIDRDRFRVVCAHVEDFSRGEEAGYLLCSISRLPDRDVLLAREWMPVPEWAIERNAHGSVLSWSSTFNSEALQRAHDMHATLVLVHSHGLPNPVFSRDDRRKEAPVFAPFSRMLDPLPTGMLLLGQGDATGSFWLGGRKDVVFRRLVIIGETVDIWHSVQLPRPKRAVRKRLVRQAPVVGPDGDAKLAETKVAIIGASGGGSHVVLQEAHQGVGTLMPLDDEMIDESNLGRVVGAVEDDIDKTTKTALAKRVATGIDSSIRVIEVEARFPSPEAIAALKDADFVVACVDTFRAREAINVFCRRYLIPLVDIGMIIRTQQERLVLADGQVIVSLPGRPCMRCWFITDAVLAKERRERPPGYDQSPDAGGEPQVVSMNGTLASEACNCVLDLVTGYSGGMRGAKFWQYEGRTGQLEQHPLPSHRPNCPACAEEGLGDGPINDPRIVLQQLWDLDGAVRRQRGGQVAGELGAHQVARVLLSPHSARRSTEFTSALGVERIPLCAHHEIPLRVRHVVTQHRRQRLHEHDPTRRDQLVLDPWVQDDHVVRDEFVRIVADRHRHRAVDDPHHLLRRLMRVPPHHRAWRVERLQSITCSPMARRLCDPPRQCCARKSRTTSLKASGSW